MRFDWCSTGLLVCWIASIVSLFGNIFQASILEGSLAGRGKRSRRHLVLLIVCHVGALRSDGRFWCLQVKWSRDLQSSKHAHDNRPYSKATSARQCHLPLSHATLRTQERLVNCTKLTPLNAMAVDATHAVTTNGDMASRPGRAYVESLRNLSQGLGGRCTPSFWQSTLCWRVAKCTRFAPGCKLDKITPKDLLHWRR